VRPAKPTSDTLRHAIPARLPHLSFGSVLAALRETHLSVFKLQTHDQ
jgi:hypothetical protein